MKLLSRLAIVIATVLIGSQGTLAAPQKIKLAHDLAPDATDPTHGLALVFESYVESRTGGRYDVEIFPSSMLGKERERLELTKANAIQVNLGSLGGLSVLYKPAILFNTPFMYSSDRVVHAVLESDFVKKLFDDMKAKTGLRSALVYDLGGLSCLTNNKQPISKIEDMKGIKFRAMDDSQVAMFRALGANAVPMAWSEVYTGLETGVVDGQVNPISIIVNAKLYEVQKYLTLSRTILGGHWVTMNDGWYTSLPADVRKIVDEALFYGNIAAKGLSQLSQARGLKTLQDSGMTVTPLTEDVYGQFQQRGRTAVLEWAKKDIDPALVDEFVATVSRIEKSLK